MGGLHDIALPEAACPQTGCLLESMDAAGMALDCGAELHGDAGNPAWDDDTEGRAP
ncbi:hypothetical protein [Pseudoxanthomonas suwonensis]|uniref:hypothetical protein n=1 Tax=Pseudoxanthomonas suwonensis TaxID=314722 RepID=UPI000AE050A9|nr:hypothetical protein [Pseudoxanthomonas suwonensis]